MACESRVSEVEIEEEPVLERNLLSLVGLRSTGGRVEEESASSVRKKETSLSSFISV